MKTAFEMNNRGIILNLELRMMKTVEKKLEHSFADNKQRNQFLEYLTGKGYKVHPTPGPEPAFGLVIDWAEP